MSKLSDDRNVRVCATADNETVKTHTLVREQNNFATCIRRFLIF